MRLNTVKYSETETFHILVRGVSPDTGTVGECGCFADDKAVQSIPITPDLLKELGFRKEDGFMRLWSKDDNGHLSYIEFSAIRDKWRLYPSGTDGSQTVVRYLHEAEAFLALHGVELIKE